MNDHLPDDVHRWPNSPWQLLCVNPGVSKKELRLAYVRLIRKYKPEFYPQQYLRIRSAYDSLKQTAGKHSETRPFESNAPLAQRSIDARRLSGCPREPADLLAEQANGQTPVTQPIKQKLSVITAADCYQQACAGQRQSAYDRLQQLVGEPSVGPEPFAMLYWLLRLDPSLGQGRTPVAWLEDGLERVGYHGVLASLFQREIDTDLSPAIGSSWVIRILSSGTISESIELGRKCFRSAARTGQWELMSAILDTLRRRSSPLEPRQWFELLLEVLDCCAWEDASKAQELFRTCWDEIQQLSEWHLEYAHSLYRYDEYSAISTAVNSVQNHEHPLLRLICDAIVVSWSQTRELLLPVVASFVQEIAADPFAALHELDAVGRINLYAYDSRAKTEIGSTAGVLFQSFYQALGGAQDDSAIIEYQNKSKLVLDFFDDVGLCTYIKLRRPLLEFCLTNLIQPELVLAVIRSDSQYDFDGTRVCIGDSLERDLSMLIICRVFEYVDAVWRAELC